MKKTVLHSYFSSQPSTNLTKYMSSLVQQQKLDCVKYGLFAFLFFF